MIPVGKLRRGAKVVLLVVSVCFFYSEAPFLPWSMQLDSGLLILVDFVYPVRLSGSCVSVDGHICQSPACNTQQDTMLRSENSVSSMRFALSFQKQLQLSTSTLGNLEINS